MVHEWGHYRMAVACNVKVLRFSIGFGRVLLQWRRGQPALTQGNLTLLPKHEQVVAYVRAHGNERVLCAFNMSANAATLALAGDTVAAVLTDSGATGAAAQGATITFEPYGVLFARLA